MPQTQNLPVIDEAIETHNARLDRKSYLRLLDEKNYHKGMLGMTSEHFVFKALLSLLPRKLKRFFVFGKNPFNYYQYKKNKEIGADIKIFVKTPHGKTVLIEVKDWELPNKPYGLEVAKSEVMARFREDADIKILVISYKNCFGYEALEFLERQGIIILELGFQVKVGESWTREMFNKFLYHRYADTRTVNRTC